jgi:hypothetical protein
MVLCLVRNLKYNCTQCTDTWIPKVPSLPDSICRSERVYRYSTVLLALHLMLDKVTVTSLLHYIARHFSYKLVTDKLPVYLIKNVSEPYYFQDCETISICIVFELK